MAENRAAGERPRLAVAALGTIFGATFLTRGILLWYSVPTARSFAFAGVIALLALITAGAIAVAPSTSRKAYGIVALAVAVIISGGAGYNTPSRGPALSTPTPTPPSFTPATRQQTNRIVYLMEEGSGLRLRNAYSARSEVHERVYFVAAEFVGPGASGQVGVWAHTGSPQDPGLTTSVNGYAQEFCVCPWGPETTSKVTMSDAPARDLERFVESRIGGR